MKWILFLMTAASSAAFAYTGTVQKIKGTRAIVDFERNAKLHEGDMVSTDSDGGGSSRTSGKFQNRDYSIGYGFSYSNMAYSESTKGTQTIINTTVQFGFSFSSFEVGPVVSYFNSQNSQSSGGTTITSYGVYGQYNLVPNKAGAVWVPFVGAKYLSTAQTGNTSITDTYMGANVGIEWFPIGNNVCLQAAFAYGQVSSTGTFANNNAGTKMEVVTGPIFGPTIYF
jgi:hypothetical protein